jgi:hypothetical protein
MAAPDARKTAFEAALRNGKSPEDAGAEGGRWTTSDGRDLEELAKRGLLFWGIKQAVGWIGLITRICTRKSCACSASDSRLFGG